MSSPEKPNDKSYDLIFKVLQRNADADEIVSFRKWLDADRENIRLFNEVKAIRFISAIHSDSDYFNTQEAWEKMLPSLTEKPVDQKGNRSSVGIFFKYAAIILIAFGMGMIFSRMVFNRSHSNTKQAYTEHIVPYGAKSQIILPDGTRIWLNAGSKLRYAQNYNQGSRVVYLEGEGYFNVTYNRKVPFWVRTYAGKIKVAGTEFNVKVYREDHTMETVVEKGTVKIFPNDSLNLFDKEIVLVKGQIATIHIPSRNHPAMPQKTIATSSLPDTTPSLSIRNHVQTILYTSWKDKRWVIEREALGDLAVDMARRYDVTIDFASQSLKNYTFSGIIENETLGQVLKVISLTAPVTYTLHKKHLVFKENKFMLKYLP